MEKEIYTTTYEGLDVTYEGFDVDADGFGVSVPCETVGSDHIEDVVTVLQEKLYHLDMVEDDEREGNTGCMWRSGMLSTLEDFEKYTRKCIAAITADFAAAGIALDISENGEDIRLTR